MSGREVQTSICHSPVGPVLIATGSYPNQDSNLGGDLSVWFPRVRLLQEPQLSEVFNPSFHGVTAKLSSSPLSSAGTSQGN